MADKGCIGQRRARVDEAEWLDQVGLPSSDVRANLRDLARVNRYLGGAGAAIGHVKEVLDELRPGDSLTLLDVACGGGDLLRTIAREAQRRGIGFMSVGVDINDHVLSYARDESPGMGQLAWVRADALRLPFRRGSFDVVMCSTYIHHLSPDQVIAFLREAIALSRGWLVVADLRRSELAYLAFRAIAWLARCHPVSRHDGAVSVRRAYLPEELSKMASAAGLTQWRLYRHPFFRMALVCGRQEV